MSTRPSTTPLDQLKSQRTGFVRIARLYSNIVSPPVMFAILGLALAWHEQPFWPGLGWAAFYGFVVSLLPIIFVFYMLKTGRIAELHMSNTRERHLPYIVAILCTIAALALLNWSQGPPLLRCLTLFNTVELIILSIINVFWLISIHATGIMATMMIVGLVFGWGAGLAIVPFVISVSWIRLYLKRHNLAQVSAGLGLGIISVLLLTTVGCFG